MSETFDIIVLGGGPGGVAAAIRGVQQGASVAIIEKDKWGGLCLNRACIPTKLVCFAGDQLLGRAVEAGLGLASAGAGLDFNRLRGQKDELVSYLSLGTQGLLGSHGARLIAGQGKLVGKGQVAVGDKVYSAKKVILASGATWVKPQFKGGDLPGVVCPDELLSEKELPGRTLVLGGRAWGLEVAQFLASAGKEAVVVEAGKNLLPDEDRQIGQRLRGIVNQPPLSIQLRTEVTGLSRDKQGLKASLSGKGPAELVVDRVVYTERRPELKGLGLDKVGLSELKVDEGQRTKLDWLLAIGDLTGGTMLSHLATAQGIVAAENALGGQSRVNLRAVPRVTYTRPQVASVGLDEFQAKEAGYDVQVGVVPLGVNAMAMILGQSDGVIKVVGERRYGELLGVQIMGPGAAEMIGQAALAIQMEATLEELARTVMPHPTLSESISDAARAALGWAIFLPKQSGA